MKERITALRKAKREFEDAEELLLGVIAMGGVIYSGDEAT